MGSYRPRHWTSEHSSSGDGSRTGVTAAQKGRTESSTNIKRWNMKKESGDNRF